MSPLDALDRDIDARVASIRTAHPEWLCGKGCDQCCRQLATLPQLTEAEWTRVKAGLAALPEAQQTGIAKRLRLSGETPARPVTCPLLDPASGACPIYRQRPIACRTYGYYVERDRGLICQQIEIQTADGRLDDVIWGNQEAIDRALAAHGPTRSLYAWFMARLPGK